MASLKWRHEGNESVDTVEFPTASSVWNNFIEIEHQLSIEVYQDFGERMNMKVNLAKFVVSVDDSHVT